MRQGEVNGDAGEGHSTHAMEEGVQRVHGSNGYPHAKRVAAGADGQPVACETQRGLLAAGCHHLTCCVRRIA